VRADVSGVLRSEDRGAGVTGRGAWRVEGEVGCFGIDAARCRGGLVERRVVRRGWMASVRWTSRGFVTV
jgi:hypothetical protein